MIFSLVKKDLRGRYKGSMLGFLWTFINPLLQLIVYTVVFSTIMRVDIDKYYLFLFVGLIPWIFFSSSLTGGANTILAHGEMVKKIYFPREVLPVSYVSSCFVNMLLTFIIIFAVVLVSGIPLNFTALICLPVIMAIEYILALGFALIISSVTVYFRDFEHILAIVMMAWMYMTPIIYKTDMIPENMRPLFSLNPMVYIINAYRDILYYSAVPSFQTLISSVIIGICSLFIGLFIFGKLKKRFAEEL